MGKEEIPPKKKEESPGGSLSEYQTKLRITLPTALKAKTDMRLRQ